VVRGATAAGADGWFIPRSGCEAKAGISGPFVGMSNERDPIMTRRGPPLPSDRRWLDCYPDAGTRPPVAAYLTTAKTCARRT